MQSRYPITPSTSETTLSSRHYMGIFAAPFGPTRIGEESPKPLSMCSYNVISITNYFVIAMGSDASFVECNAPHFLHTTIFLYWVLDTPL